MGGPNGLTPMENLVNIKRAPVFEKEAEPVLGRCPSHPTKRAWDNEIEAAREAVARSAAVKIPIVAIRCGACHKAHLCKAANAKEGTVITLPTEPERNWEVFVPTPGNRAARLKSLRAWLDGREAVATDDVMRHLECGRKTATSLMVELGWQSGRGRTARWTVASTAPVTKLAPKRPKPVAEPALEASIARHPASSGIAWRDMDLETIRHIPVGDLLDVLRAAGAELRIQARGSALSV